MGPKSPVTSSLISSYSGVSHTPSEKNTHEVMHAMNAWKDEARVQHFACLALSNFAHDDSNKVAIGILGNSAISIIFWRLDGWMADG